MIPHLVALVVGHALEALRLGVEVALLAAVRLNKVFDDVTIYFILPP